MKSMWGWLLFAAVVFGVYRPTSTASRQKRFLSSVIDFLATGGRCKGCSHRCLDDPVVIDGYCCGCARDSDYLPVNCHAIHGQCPPDGRRVCRTYDYMLDCCCP